MELKLILTAVIFLLSTFLFWKLTKSHFEKEAGKKMFKTWTARTYFWQGVLFFSGGITFLIIFLLKSGEYLTF